MFTTWLRPLTWLLCAALWARGAGAADAAATLPAEAFFRSPALSGAVLSPAGRLVALRVGAPGSRDRLAVLDLSTMKVQPVASFDDADVTDFHWVHDGRLVFMLGDRRLPAADRAFAPGLYAVNADGSGYKQLVQREHVGVRDNIGSKQLPWNTFLLGERGPQTGDEVLVVRPEAYGPKGFDFVKLLRLNTVSGRAEEVDAPLRATQWLVDARGRLRAVRTEEDDRAAFHWRDAESGAWRRLREFERFGNTEMNLAAIGPDDQLYVTARAGADTEAVYTYDPAKDALSAQPVFRAAQFDIAPQFIANDQRLLGLRFAVDAELTHWLDEGMKAHQAVVDQLLPATANMLSPPRRGDSPWLLVRAFADVQPTQYLLFHTGTKKLTRLGGQQPAIQPAQMSPMDFVRYKARDGLEIPAYLTLPAAAAEKKQLPLIVYVHGGPWARGATWEWRADVQFLASRGYAVLMPEFRGSTGFGERHFRAGWKQWGLAMQDDLADGARWAIAQGIADPQRICIMGASYGGYATLMGLAKDGDLFRCGVQWVGVSDLLLLYDASWDDISPVFKRHGLPKMLGDREKDAALLRANSPVNLAARITNPLLMAYGRIDRRVPIEHGERLRDALKAHNPNLEWVLYDKEGHGWSLPATDIDWWTRVEKFLARHLARSP